MKYFYNLVQYNESVNAWDLREGLKSKYKDFNCVYDVDVSCKIYPSELVKSQTLKSESSRNVANNFEELTMMKCNLKTLNFEN
ncbi:hypothetical protein BpHYR1_026837 [Brachionus plicatilis]|uniref:Uncharacterized protein n=1 Tax=Brachionus plicatilis TaxID=10195 RepID=A0A3M7P8R0_BRAPC|nr:hypothetical protein BpHYR1_026837 [Brachionus plicatilis]